MKRAYYLFLVGAVLLLSGCKVDLYSNLSEVDANQMLALLASNQIEGDKKADKSGNLILRVEKSDFVKAVEVLRQNGYPRRAYRAVDELFPSGQLVSSPVQEQAKIRFLREQSLERMLSNIGGVVSANVVIADGNTENGDKSNHLPSVSVLVKYSPEVNLRSLGGQLKNLIHNALPGVNQDRISLVVQAVDYRFAAPEVKTMTPVTSSSGSDKAKTFETKGISLWTLLGFWLLSTLAIIGHGLWLHRRRQLIAGVSGSGE